MNIEEAKEYLKEMKDNCIKGMMKGAIYTDEKAEKKALAIETVLSELDRLKKYEDLEWQEFNELAVASLELEKKDKEIAYWKEQAEGYSGLAKQIQEEYENRIDEFVNRDRFE